MCRCWHIWCLRVNNFGQDGNVSAAVLLQSLRLHYLLFFSHGVLHLCMLFLLVVVLTWSHPSLPSPLFSFSVLVPLTRSVYEPATRMLLQSDIETEKQPAGWKLSSNKPPTDPDRTSHLIQNITTQCRKFQQHNAYRGTLDSFTQSEGGPIWSKDGWMNGKMNEWTRGCQDKEGVRGHVAASRHLSWNQHNTAVPQEEPEEEKAVDFSYVVRTNR